MGNVKRLMGYFTANAVQAGVGFFSTPLLVQIIGKNELGRWALIEPVVQIASILALLGMNWGIVKLLGADKFALGQTFSRVYRGALPVIALVATLVGTLGLYKGLPLSAAVALSIWICAEASLTLALAGFRGANAVQGYFLGVCCKYLALVGLLGLVRFTSISSLKTAELAIYIWSAAASTGALVSVLVMIRGLRSEQAAEPSKIVPSGVYRDAIGYGFPLLLASFLGMLQLYSDRYILNLYVPKGELGAYVVHAKVAAAMSFIMTPIGLWWPTARFQHANDEDGGSAFFSGWALRLLVFYVVSGFVLWVLSPFLIHWFAPDVVPRKDVAGFLIMSIALSGIAVPLNVGLIKEGHTRLNFYAAIVYCMFQMVLCFLLARHFSVLGAAIAASTGALFSLCLQNYLSQRVHPVVYSYKEMMTFAGGFLASVTLSLHFLGFQSYIVGVMPTFAFLLAYIIYRWRTLLTFG